MLILHLPEADDEPVPWSLWEDGARAAGGDDARAAPPPGEGLAVIATAPAEAVVIHRVDLPDLAPAQARAAALLLATGSSTAPASSLHVALDRADEAGSRLMAVTGKVRMSHWLARLTALGFDPQAVIPAPLLLPQPEAGFVRGEVGGCRLVRGRDAAFADDPMLAPLILVDADVVEVGEPAPDAAALEAALDLRQGVFARARRFGLDWKLVRRLSVLTGIAACLVLATVIVRIGQHSLAANAAERRAAELARQALPAGAPVDDPVDALSRRLAGLQGPGGGFPALSSAVIGALGDAPGVDLVEMDYGEGGRLRILLAGPDAPSLSVTANGIQNRGWRVELGPTSEADGRQRVELTVSER